MNPWTKEDSDRLYAMWCEGVPYSEIADTLGRKVQSVKHKLHSWALRRNTRAREETAAEVRRLVAEGMTKAQAAKHLGITAKYARTLTAKHKGNK